MSTLSMTRRRAAEQRMEEAIRALPREVKAGIMKDVDRHAPELRDLMTECGALPHRLRVRDGDGWRDVVSPEIVRRYTEEQQ